MPSLSRRRLTQLASLACVLGLSAACAHGGASAKVDPSLRGATAIERQIQGGHAAPRLDHLMPARDSQGSLPKRFEWTAVPGADEYSIGVWNEIDMLVWRHDRIAETSFVPTDLELAPGTYFWTISALKDGDEIASSGLSAFVVRPPNP